MLQGYTEVSTKGSQKSCINARKMTKHMNIELNLSSSAGKIRADQTLDMQVESKDLVKVAPRFLEIDFTDD